MKNIDTLIKDYYQWLKDNTFLYKDQQTGWTQITTPFLGLFNDMIEIYVKYENDKVLLSDDGETLTNLELYGINITKSQKKQEILHQILLTYGIKIKGKELTTEATIKNFPQKKHDFISAITEINDMIHLTKQNVTSLFKEEVRSYLDTLDIIYTPDFIAKGTTGLDFNFDFQIAHKTKETVIKTFNKISQSQLISFLFAWEDIKPARESRTHKTINGIAIINDTNPVEDQYITAIKNKNADYILWSARKKPNNINKIIA